MVLGGHQGLGEQSGHGFHGAVAVGGHRGVGGGLGHRHPRYVADGGVAVDGFAEFGGLQLAGRAQLAHVRLGSVLENTG